MVVILLLTPYTTNGCDGGSHGEAEDEEKSSSTNKSNKTVSSSTTSTGDTAIPTARFRPPGPTTAYTANRTFSRSQQQQEQEQHSTTPNSSQNLSRTNHRTHYATPTTTNSAKVKSSWNCYLDTTVGAKTSSPSPPPLPKSKPPYESYYRNRNGQRMPAATLDSDRLRANAVPKPPRSSGAQCPPKTKAISQRCNIGPEKPPLMSREATTANVQPKSQLHQKKQQKHHQQQHQHHRPQASKISRKTNPNTNFSATSNDFVRHVTRVNFYDIDTSQVEFLEPKDGDDDDAKNCDTEAITKDEEWITKRKTELTTTRQIETRVKRQVVLEDGKVVEDSGPIVSTNTTEDTDKQETETTEKRDLGIPQDAQGGVTTAALEGDHVDGQIADFVGGGKLVKKMVARPADGLVRESNDKRVVSHEEIKDYLETEDRHHLGDFSDETYVKAVNSGAENLQEILQSAESQKQLVPLGPRIVANTSKSRKTIDSEDTLKRSLAQPDGKIVTESKKTTEHEVIVDEELPEKDDHSTGSREKITTVEATQRYYKQRDEQNVDTITDGKVVGTEMRYAAETMQVEKDGLLDRPGDWDSLSDRMRKLRRPPQPKTLLQQHKEAALLADRKDALTKRPLDFDREEETRKGETMKWLESHFGSESTASNDSRDDDANGGGEVEPTKKTYFNVTIKSNQPQNLNDKKYLKESGGELATPPPHVVGASGRSKYYQGISNWAERKETPTNHFATKAFREDLQETIERNRLRKGVISSSRDKLNEGRYLVEPNDNYVSRDDILHQKRQSLSSQFLARSRRSSRDQLEHLEQATSNTTSTMPPHQRETGLRQISGSRTDLRYGLPNTQDEIKRGYTRLNSNEHNGHDVLAGRSQIAGYNVATMPSSRIDNRSKSYERELNDRHEPSLRYDATSTAPRTVNTLRHSSKPRRSSSPDEVVVPMQTSTLGRPTVPQRRRAIEKKMLRQQSSISPPLNVSLEHLHQRRGGDLAEPPPDYSPPPRSRSSSPQIDYIRRSSPRETSAYPDPITNTTTTTSTLTRKQNQRTRFAPSTPSTPTTTTNYHPTSTAQLRPVATQTTQTTPPSNISTSTAASHKSSNKVGQVIGNSLRKLVSKIRSASAERKLRMKSKSKSREQSPSPQTTLDKQQGSSSYQQYNVIDSHIIGSHQPIGPESELECKISSAQAQKIDNTLYSNSAAVFEQQQQQRSGNQQHQHHYQPDVVVGFKHTDTPDPYTREDRDERDQGPSPRQRYYLGEDPYSSTLYGKENIYDPKSIAKRLRNPRETIDSSYNMQRNNNNNREASVGMQKRNDESMVYSQRNTSSNTLGRYQKSGQRFAGSTPNLNQDYRTTQTLPRKLNDHHHYPQQHQQQQYQRTAATQRVGYSHTLGHPERRNNAATTHYQQSQATPMNSMSGPAKPARTYAKVLNRSKSFNVHGMNGGTDPSPIYIEKLTKNNYNNNSLHASQAYKSNPHLYSSSSAATKENSSSLLQSGLKSPSIVNLISRSQKDLSKLGVDDDENDADEQRDLYNSEHGGYSNNNKRSRGGHLQRDEKKQIFLQGLHQQAPDLYKTLHGDDENYHPSAQHHHHIVPTTATHHPTKYHLQPKHSLDSSTRSPIEINKDTASIVRRGSTSTNDDYVTSSTSYNYARASELAQNKRILMYKDDQTTRRRGSGSTIIEVRNIDSRK